MEILLTLAVVAIVALIVIAMDQAAQLEVERALHKADRTLWKGKEALLHTAVAIGDVTLDKWEQWADRATKIDGELRQRIVDLEEELTSRFMDLFDDQGWSEDGAEEAQAAYDADEFGFCLNCGANHEQEDATAGMADSDYKRAEDVVVTNAV